MIVTFIDLEHVIRLFSWGNEENEVTFHDLFSNEKR